MKHHQKLFEQLKKDHDHTWEEEIEYYFLLATNDVR
jgi:hypothetical protein